tara:strand:- start:285 stop:503 length:219 start_codon:yes stop_codon:yes gene_type:complete
MKPTWDGTVQANLRKPWNFWNSLMGMPLPLAPLTELLDRFQAQTNSGECAGSHEFWSLHLFNFVSAADFLGG